MPIDPLDQQLVEAVLTRPLRGRAEMEEAKLAGMRPARTAVVEPEEEDVELDVIEEGPAAGDLAVEAADGADLAEKLPVDAPAKLDAKELEEPSAEELEALSADMIGIDDPVRMYLKEIGKVPLLNAAQEVLSLIHI